jgi:zinc/manganese transport system substrate-binding protein
MKGPAMTKRFIAAILAIVFVSASAQAADKIKAVASFSILGDFVARVGAERIELVTIVGPDGDAHVYEPKPADVKAVAAAHAVFVNGLAFEGWLERLMEASGYKGLVTTVTTNVAVQAMPGGETDPHAWQSAANARVYVENIARGLCDADKPGCESYNANAAAYAKELAGLDVEIKAAVAKIPEDRRVVITSHDAFGYFAKAYGIRFIAPEGVSTESEASAKDVARLITQIREQKASALFVETISDPRLIEQIARETGLKVGGALYSDALSGPDGPAPTYIEMMRHNARLFTEAMAGS